MIGFGQNVNIPDANFKSYLVNNSTINTNGDNEIQVSEANAFTGGISCYNEFISDLTGIEAFTALTTLVCSGNYLTSLNISSNTALTFLNCINNNLTSLDVSGATALNTLYCFDNQLTSLDVSSNSVLNSLNCKDNQLTSLDLSNNPIIQFTTYNNNLNCLNLKNGNNSSVTLLWTYGNPNLTCIEVDDVNYSTANWTVIDSQTSFSTDCGNDCSACTPTSSIDTHTACDSFTWLDGNNYTASNNTATYTTTNAAGCDSVITIDLTINPTPSGAVTQNGATLTATQTGATYQWIDCDDESNIVGEINQAFTPAVTGSYAVIVTIGDCFKKSDCFLVDFTGIGELNNTPKQLIKIVDVVGRETPFKPNTPLLYIYDDGTVERKVVLK